MKISAGTHSPEICKIMIFLKFLDKITKKLPLLANKSLIIIIIILEMPSSTEIYAMVILLKLANKGLYKANHPGLQEKEWHTDQD